MQAPLISVQGPAGPGQPPVFHPGRDHGARLRLGEDPRLQHVQVPEGSPQLSALPPPLPRQESPVTSVPWNLWSVRPAHRIYEKNTSIFA